MGLRRTREQGSGESYTMSSFMTSTPHQILFGRSRRMRQVGHVAYMVDSTGAYRVFVGNLRERDNFEDLGIDVRIIFKWIFKK